MATLRQLKAFVATAEFKKMSEAAKHLYISQPTVSQIISELEKEYGTPLFERQTRELRITPAGEILLKSAREIIAIHESLDRNMKSLNARRPLRVGATLTVGDTMISDLAVLLKERCPDIDLSVTVHNTRRIEDMLLRSELDLALSEGVINHPDIVTKPVFVDHLCLICGKTHPFASRDAIALRELRDQEFILRERGSGTRAIFEKIMSEHNLPFVAKWECNSSRAIAEAVRRGLGLGFISDRCVQEEIRSGEIFPCPLPEISMSRFFYLCRCQYQTVTSQMADFSDLINAVLAPSMR